MRILDPAVNDLPFAIPHVGPGEVMASSLAAIDDLPFAIPHLPLHAA